MLSYCLKCSKKTKSKNPRIVKTKEQDASELLSNLRVAYNAVA